MCECEYYHYIIINNYGTCKGTSLSLKCIKKFLPSLVCEEICTNPFSTDYINCRTASHGNL